MHSAWDTKNDRNIYAIPLRFLWQCFRLFKSNLKITICLSRFGEKIRAFQNRFKQNHPGDCGFKNFKLFSLLLLRIFLLLVHQI